MRDPERIKKILGMIEKIWMESPDQRFYQLLINIGVFPDSNYWHIEDDVVEEHLKTQVKKYSKRRNDDENKMHSKQPDR